VACTVLQGSIGLQEAGKLEAVFKAAGFLTELRRGDGEDPISGLAARAIHTVTP